jgi:hypothetical protein
MSQRQVCTQTCCLHFLIRELLIDSSNRNTCAFRGLFHRRRVIATFNKFNGSGLEQLSDTSLTALLLRNSSIHGKT